MSHDTFIDTALFLSRDDESKRLLAPANALGACLANMDSSFEKDNTKRTLELFAHYFFVLAGVHLSSSASTFEEMFLDDVVWPRGLQTKQLPLPTFTNVLILLKPRLGPPDRPSLFRG
mmetsp:Transcript_3177/g.7460  ORF Transcript_3177/g.7460 Transcript_3177/m.7460 type:complete len:118 (+) Transcript_3177:89-442(+)